MKLENILEAESWHQSRRSEKQHGGESEKRKKRKKITKSVAANENIKHTKTSESEIIIGISIENRALKAHQISHQRNNNQNNGIENGEAKA